MAGTAGTVGAAGAVGATATPGGAAGGAACGGWGEGEQVVWSGVEAPYLVTHNAVGLRSLLGSLFVFKCGRPAGGPAAGRAPASTLSAGDMLACAPSSPVQLCSPGNGLANSALPWIPPPPPAAHPAPRGLEHQHSGGGAGFCCCHARALASRRAPHPRRPAGARQPRAGRAAAHAGRRRRPAHGGSCPHAGHTARGGAGRRRRRDYLQEVSAPCCLFF